MKMTKCTAYCIQVPAPVHGPPRLYLIKVDTDAGISGWGEACCQHFVSPETFPAIVNMVFEKYMSGRSPFEREKNLQRAYVHFTSNHPDIFSGGILSAFDMAMWDITGKAYGIPVYEMLGGRFRDKLRSYTYIYEECDWMKPEKVARNAERYAEMGYTALKFDPIPAQVGPGNGEKITPWGISNRELDNAEECLVQLRKTVGRDIDIIIGAHGQLTTSAAIRTAKMFEKYDVMWYEEPIQPESVEELKIVARSTTVPIACGERMCFTHEFRRLLEADACAVAQPDLGAAGGISEGKKICGMAEPYYVQIAPHVWGGPVCLAAALQLDTAVPNFLIQETINEAGGFFNDFLKEPFIWERGYLYCSDRPGLGIDIDEDALHKYLI